MPSTPLTHSTHITRGAPDPDLDPVGSEVGSGKYWPDLHNYDIKHHSIFSFKAGPVHLCRVAGNTV